MKHDVPSLAKPAKHSFKANSHFITIAIELLVVLALALFTAQIARAQQFQTLYRFTGENDGGSPWAGVTIANSGLLYGTTTFSEGPGGYGYGTVYALKNRGSGWTVDPLYYFPAQAYGEFPYAGVVIGPNGALYGTTLYGGSDNGGTVFELQPAPNFCRTVLCPWNETIALSFDGNDGSNPVLGNVTFDQAGNLYGTASKGGNEIGGEGTVYQLTPSGSVKVLYTFCCIGYGTDGYDPQAGVIFDPQGNLYGTTVQGGAYNLGTVFELTPFGNGRWAERIIHSFTGVDGAGPAATLIRDSSGNLYGTTYGDETNNNGTVFMLSYSDGWVFTLLYTFNSCNPTAGVTLDAAGNLYGVCAYGGAFGNMGGFVFKLTNSNGTWSLTDLHDFNRGDNDGYDPLGTPAFDSNGNLFGTTSSGGNPRCLFGCGSVWEITGLSDRR